MRLNGKDIYLSFLKGDKGDTGPTEVRVNDIAQSRVDFDSDPQTQIDGKADKNADNLSDENVTDWRTKLGTDTMVELWSNPNPNVAFAGQSVTLSDAIENYDFYEVLFKDWYGGSSYFPTGKVPSGSKTTLFNIGADVITAGSALNNFIVNRLITSVSGTTITFADNVAMTWSGSNLYGEIKNSLIIPYKVYGYKK